MKNLIFLAIILAVSNFSDTSTENLFPTPDPYCLSSLPISGVLPIGDTCEEDTLSPEYVRWCDVIQMDTVMLEESSKCWIPQYQFDIGKEFYYEKESGDLAMFTLTDKGHIFSQKVLKTEACDTSEYALALCYTIESYYIILENFDDQIELYIGMSLDRIKGSDPDYKDNIDEKMHIYKIHDYGYSGNRLQVEEFDDTPYMLNAFEEEKRFRDQTFKNVYRAGQYYYTKEVGLIAMNNGKWILQ
ncbi:MAG: hypothetical protein AAFP19_02125 [Bacteroidota bacterium]